MSEPLHVALIRMQAKHQQVCREAFKELNLTDGQPKILLRLLKTDGLLQKDLSAQCGVMPATMTSLLQNMVAAGPVEKREVRISGGKHGYQIFLTDTGREAAGQVAGIMSQVEERCYQGFSDKEKKRLVDYLNRCEQNLCNT